MPLRNPLDSFCKISLDKTLIAIVKREGDSESPCQRSRLELKKPTGDPLIRIEKVGVEIHWLMRWIHLSENPKCLKMDKRRGHSTLLKAFSISNLRATNPSELDFFWCIVWKISWAMLELSCMFLLGIDAACQGDTRLGRRDLSLLARILEIVL